MQTVFTIAELVGFAFGLTWVALSVVQGNRDRRTPLPALVLCGIAAYDGSALTGLTSALGPVIYVFDPFFVVFELYLFWQFFRDGPKDYPRIPRCLLMIFVTVALVLTVVGAKLLGLALHDDYAVTTGMILEMMVPALCLPMLYRRGSAAGQSLPGAVCLLVSLTALSTAAVADPPPGQSRPLLIFLGIAQTLLQAGYLWALHRYRQADRRGAHAVAAADDQATAPNQEANNEIPVMNDTAEVGFLGAPARLNSGVEEATRPRMSRNGDPANCSTSSERPNV